MPGTRVGRPPRNRHPRTKRPSHNRHPHAKRPSHNRHSGEGQNPGAGLPPGYRSAVTVQTCGNPSESRHIAPSFPRRASIPQPSFRRRPESRGGAPPPGNRSAKPVHTWGGALEEPSHRPVVPAQSLPSRGRGGDPRGRAPRWGICAAPVEVQAGAGPTPHYPFTPSAPALRRVYRGAPTAQSWGGSDASIGDRVTRTPRV